MEGSPKLLDLMFEKKWHVKREEETMNEKNLQLSLGPPGDDNSTNINKSQVASFGYLSEMTSMPLNPKTNIPSWSSTASFLQLQSIQSCPATGQGKVAVTQKESSQPCCTKVVDLQQQLLLPAGKKTFSAINTAVPSNAQKRTAPAPVVGWPPIRSFRKNLASSSSLKLSSELPDVIPNKAAAAREKPAENNQKGLFVKINMDGIVIGRKVDLKAYDSYDKLSSAVDELFRGLLAAQSDSSENGAQKNEGRAIISGLLDGSGEYTLVYEDNEGDRMLVGDVPWHMFVSTVKRLRVLKTSELPMLRRGAKQGKMTMGT